MTPEVAQQYRAAVSLLVDAQFIGQISTTFKTLLLR
jgi:hypothetical protein